jgi:hypothetical protein
MSICITWRQMEYLRRFPFSLYSAFASDVLSFSDSRIYPGLLCVERSEERGARSEALNPQEVYTARIITLLIYLQAIFHALFSIPLSLFPFLQASLSTSQTRNEEKGF